MNQKIKTLQMENNRKYGEREEQGSNFGQQIISKFVPYWPLLLLMILLCMVGAYLYLRYATPVYEAAATILIKSDKTGTNDNEALQTMTLIQSNKDVDNEIEVLSSRSLMETVVKKLCLYAPLYQKGQIKTGDAYVTSPIVIEAQNPDSISEVENVNFEYDRNTQNVILDNKDRYPLNQFVSTAYGVLRFIPNKYYRPGAESSKQMAFSLEDYRNVAVAYSRNLKVGSAKASALVDLTYRDAVPQRAVDVLKTLTKEYEAKSLEEKNITARKTLAYINERLDLLRNDLDSIDRKVQHYKTGANAVNIGEQAGIYLNAVAASDQKRGEYKNQIAVLDEVENYMSSKSNEPGIVPSTLGVNDPTLSALVSKLNTSEMEYEKQKKTVGERNPILLSKAEEINKLKESIGENIKSQKASIAASTKTLDAQAGSYSSLLSTVPTKEKDLMQISRERQTKGDQFNFLLQKKQEAELTITTIAATSKPVDEALAAKDPVSPKKKMIYMMAFVAACGLFGGIIIVKDTFTGKVKYRNEIEKMTALPIIGEIAYEKTTNPIVIEKGTRSFVAEEFRKLRISLSFLGIDSNHRKLLLTSSISGEGKSFIATNLAVSLSLTGKKVVLVDLDLNNPSVSKMLNVHYEDGATEYLSGEKTEEEIINKLEAYENLYFISAGSLPENPTELLANGKVESLINYLDKHFDMVVIDTSPAVLVTDAFILSGLCDATLYVVRHDYTPKMLVRRIDESLEINPINNPAIVFNGVKTRGVFKNNYGYGYDYVYGNKDRGNKTRKAS
ncbi:MAG: polysaccharide biosynthesis tyrosine autokinase [Bacteroidetes bacterium]|nr:polysaccharide biosynthesis tyrosine autokinase [Bacteroidota bacterium]